MRGERAAHASERVRGVRAPFRGPHTRTLEPTPEPEPAWVTGEAPPDDSDPIGAHDEDAEPYVFEVEP